MRIEKVLEACVHPSVEIKPGSEEAKLILRAALRQEDPPTLNPLIGQPGILRAESAQPVLIKPGCGGESHVLAGHDQASLGQVQKPFLLLFNDCVRPQQRCPAVYVPFESLVRRKCQGPSVGIRTFYIILAGF